MCRVGRCFGSKASLLPLRSTLLEQLGEHPGTTANAKVINEIKGIMETLRTNPPKEICGAPVITVNEDVYGRLAPEDVDTILAKYE